MKEVVVISARRSAVGRALKGTLRHTRPDDVGTCLSPSDALAMAPAAEDGRFRVPRILDEEV